MNSENGVVDIKSSSVEILICLVLSQRAPQISLDSSGERFWDKSGTSHSGFIQLKALLSLRFVVDPRTPLQPVLIDVH